jgi:hypothetical protein
MQNFNTIQPAFSPAIFKLSDVIETQFDELMAAIADKFRRYLRLLYQCDEAISACAFECSELDNECAYFVAKSNDMLPPMYSAILHEFFTATPQIVNDFRHHKAELVSDHAAFHEFFGATSQHVSEFVGPKAKYALNGVLMHLHSWMMQQIPLKMFVVDKQFEATKTADNNPN